MFVTKRHDSAYGPPDLAGRTALEREEALAKGVVIDEVRERLHAVDLDHGQESSIARLQLGVSGDVDEVELEAELGAHVGHDLERAGAEAAVGGVIDPDSRSVSHREAAAQ